MQNTQCIGSAPLSDIDEKDAKQQGARPRLTKQDSTLTSPGRGCNGASGTEALIP